MKFGLENFVQEEQREEKIWIWKNLTEEAERGGDVGLRIICRKSKMEKATWTQNILSKIREKEEKSHPLSGKEKYDQVGCADRLQNNSMLPFHGTNRKKAPTNVGSS